MISKHSFARLIMVALMSLALPSTSVLAATAKTTKPAPAKSDRGLPMVVEADTADYQDIEQTSHFKGRVILTQGTMRIEADMVETITDPEGYQYAVATMNKGGLVHFTQTRAGSNEIMKAQGSKLVYDSKTNHVILTRNAQRQRLTPTGGLIDHINGDELVYNQLTEVFESHQIKNAKGRTRVVITPNSNVK